MKRFKQKRKLLFLLIVLWGATLALYAQLPEPQGPYCPAKQQILINDPGREEVYTPNPEDHRKLVLNLWYPGDNSGTPVAYMRPELFRLFRASRKVADSIDLSSMQRAKTHSRWGGAMPAALGKAPVLLFSHGSSTPVEVYTTLFEHLSSHGYVVGALVHTYNATATEFPDGTIIPANRKYFDSRWTPDIEKRWQTMMTFVKSDASPEEKRLHVLELFTSGFPATQDMKIWQQDISAAIDQLYLLNEDTGSFLYQRLDLDRLGGFGHSYGGSAMAHSLMTEPRLEAAINLDGWQFGDQVLGKPFPKPFLYIRGGYPQPDALNTVAYASAGAHFRQLKLKNTQHQGFGDLPLFTGPYNVFDTGTLRPQRHIEVLNAVVQRFFDMTLRQDRKGWEQLGSQFPELSFE